MPGRATCGSCATCWSAPWCSSRAPSWIPRRRPTAPAQRPSSWPKTRRRRSAALTPTPAAGSAAPPSSTAYADSPCGRSAAGMAFRSVGRRRSRVGALAFLLSLCTGPRPATASPIDPLALARALADLGPRPVGSEAHARAAALLLEAMRGAGLERVEAMEEPGSPPLRNLTGVVAGQTEDEILLAAHYDTVATSPGAGDDASGCAAVLAAAADLRRTPLRHTVRVVLFDGEEQGLRGSRAWVEGLEPDRRDRVL